MIPRLLRILACAVLSVSDAAAVAAPLPVVYAGIEGQPVRDDYGHQLLALAAQKGGHEFTVSRYPETVAQARAVQLIQSGKDVQVGWFGTGSELEAALRPVRIPIDKGILGYRVFIIEAGRQAAFSAVKSLDDLRALSAGQGLGWTDIGILRANGITVQAASFDLLFPMLARGRFDFLPLGANEVFLNAEKHGPAAGRLVVERDLVLVYPFAMYFFVTPDRRDLADAIERGLKAAIQDGSFDRLVSTHPWLRDAFSRAELSRRRVIPIANPLLSDRLKDLPAEYFYRP